MEESLSTIVQIARCLIILWTNVSKYGFLPPVSKLKKERKVVATVQFEKIYEYGSCSQVFASQNNKFLEMPNKHQRS